MNKLEFRVEVLYRGCWDYFFHAESEEEGRNFVDRIAFNGGRARLREIATRSDIIYDVGP